MTRIQRQMQVINDDKSWIQLQRLSPSEVGDHTMIVLTGCFLGKCRVLKKNTNGKCCAQKLAHKVSPRCLKAFAPW